MLRRAGCLCGNVLPRFVKQERVRPAFSHTQLRISWEIRRVLIERYKINMPHLREGNVKMVVGAGGGGAGKGSCSPGKGSKGLQDFLSCSVKSLGFSTVLLLGSFSVLKLLFLIFNYVLQVPEKSATFLQLPAAASLSGTEMAFLQLQYCFPDSL